MEKKYFLKLVLVMLIIVSGFVSLSKSGECGENTPLFSFIQITDTHFLDEAIDPYVAQLAEEINSMEPKPAFLIHTGDMVEKRSELAFQGVKASFSLFELPVYTVVGNHDIGQGVNPPMALEKELYRKFFGELSYSFDYNGYHCIILDTTIDTTGTSRTRKSETHVTQQAIDWLKNDLANLGEKTPIILFTHYPLYDKEHGFYFADNGDEVLELLREYNLKASFSGHTHRQIDSKLDGIDFYITPNIACHATGMSNAQGYYRIVKVYPNHIETKVKEIKIKPIYFDTFEDRLLQGWNGQIEDKAAYGKSHYACGLGASGKLVGFTKKNMKLKLREDIYLTFDYYLVPFKNGGWKDIKIYLLDKSRKRYEVKLTDRQRQKVKEEGRWHEVKIRMADSSPQNTLGTKIVRLVLAFEGAVDVEKKVVIDNVKIYSEKEEGK